MLDKIKDAIGAFCRAIDKAPKEQLKDDLVGIIGCAIIGYFVSSICTMKSTFKSTKL